MDNKATIAIVQFTPQWDNKPANYRNIQAILASIHADIVVLPELCTTGYSFLSQQEALASADKASTIADAFQAYADQSGTVIVAGFAEKDGDKAYNSAIVVSPDQPFVVYRKTHLFFKEKDCFEPGNSGFKVVKHPLIDCNIGVMVCYDWRFPESARTLALQGADLIVCPSNLVTSVWEIGMRSRALENNVFVAVANRCGKEMRYLDDGSTQELVFTGKSALYNINGKELAQATEDKDGVITFTIDIAQSRHKMFNSYNDIFLDRNPAMYKL